MDALVDAAKPLFKLKITPRELQILDLLSKYGYSNKRMAYEIGISEATIKVHLKNLMRKMSVRNRTGLVINAEMNYDKTKD